MKFFIPIVNTNSKSISITNLNNSTGSINEPLNMIMDGNLYSKGYWAAHPDYPDLRRLQFHNFENIENDYSYKFSCLLASEVFFGSNYKLDFYSGQNPGDSFLNISSITGNGTFYANQFSPIGVEQEKLDNVLLEFTNTSIPTGSYIYNTVDSGVDSSYFYFNHIQFGRTYTMNLDLYIKTEFEYEVEDSFSDLNIKKRGGYFLTSLASNKLKRNRQYVISEVPTIIKDELIYIFKLCKTLPFYLFDEQTDEVFYVRNSKLAIKEEYAGAYTITYVLEDVI